MDPTKAAVIEFFLFASQQPLSIVELKEMIGDMEIDQIQEAIDWLRNTYYAPGRALQICEMAGGYQICTRPEFHPWLKSMAHYNVRRRLTRAALEVLSIIAYKQPITKYEIEAIRGANSGYMLRNLLRQKLIRIIGRKDCPGRPLVYGTGKEFLNYFGLTELAQLPKEYELKELIRQEETEERSDQAE